MYFFCALTLASCVKDRLYILDDNGSGSGEGNNDNQEYGDTITRISSLIIISDNYSQGIPAIHANGKETYTVTNSNGNSSTFTSSKSSDISEISEIIAKMFFIGVFNKRSFSSHTQQLKKNEKQ